MPIFSGACAGGTVKVLTGISQNCTLTIYEVPSPVVLQTGKDTGMVTVEPGDETCNLSAAECGVEGPTGSTVDAQLSVSATFPGESGLTGSSGSTTVAITLRATDIAMDCSSACFKRR